MERQLPQDSLRDEFAAPSPEELLGRLRERKAATGTRLDIDGVLSDRDGDRT